MQEALAPAAPRSRPRSRRASQRTDAGARPRLRQRSLRLRAERPDGDARHPDRGDPRPGTRRGMDALAALVAERDAQRVVVGLPLSLSGEDSAQTRETREFAARLARRLSTSGRGGGARGALRRALHHAHGPADGGRGRARRTPARRRTCSRGGWLPGTVTTPRSPTSRLASVSVAQRSTRERQRAREERERQRGVSAGGRLRKTAVLAAGRGRGGGCVPAGAGAARAPSPRHRRLLR